MTINEKHLEKEEHKSGDHQVAGTPITSTEDSALKHRQETLDATKSFRLTKGDNPFTIDMGDGAQVQDKRQQNKETTATEQSAGGSRDLIPTRVVIKDGTTYHQDKDGKWVEEKEKHPLPKHSDVTKAEPKHEQSHHQHHRDDGALHIELPFSRAAAPDVLHSKELPGTKENSEKGETPAEAAKHGALVWHKKDDGTYEPTAPPGYPGLPSSAGLMEFKAWQRMNSCGANRGNVKLQPEKGDTVDGKKFEG